MNYSIIIYILGHIFNFAAVFMILPCITAVIYQEPAGLWFLVCGLVLAFVGVLLSKKKPENKKIYAKEGMVIVKLAVYQPYRCSSLYAYRQYSKFYKCVI